MIPELEDGFATRYLQCDCQHQAMTPISQCTQTQQYFSNANANAPSNRDARTHMKHLENADVVPYPLFLVLCDAFRYPRDITDLLCHGEQTDTPKRIRGGLPAPLISPTHKRRRE